jgi:hypothetical protein
MTAKMYTKLASIEINNEILSKVGGFFLGKTFKNVKNEVKIQKLLYIGFLEFLEFLENNFSRNSRK